MSESRTVAVIGTGPNGLVAAKYMLEAGLTPTIFEKSSGIGGMWNPECHPSWKSLRTNLSRFTSCYTDLQWRDNVPMFPSQADMHQYLQDYCTQYIPPQYFLLNTTVLNVKQTKLDKWEIRYTNVSREQVGIFDFIVVATGFFSDPYIPPIPLSHDSIIHSSEYRNPTNFIGHKVVIVGSSFSSSEIAGEIAPFAESVINIVSRPFWSIPRYIPLQLDNPSTPFLPVDLVFYSRTGRKSFEEIVEKGPAEHEKSNEYFNKMLGGREDFQPEGSGLPFVAISDDYLAHAQNERILPKLGRIKAAFNSKILLEDGSRIENVDSVIFCTGFRPTFPFLNDDILEKISFDPNDSFNPLLLYKSMLCPTLPGLAFIGVYRGPYFLIAELQAMLAAKLYSGQLPPIPVLVQEEGILIEKQIREQTPRPQFPHPDYIGFAYSLAKLLGIVPSEEWARNHSILAPFDFRLENKFAQMGLTCLEKEYEKFLSGKMIGDAVFRSLAGSWTFQQKVRNGNNSSTTKGSANFSLEYGHDPDCLDCQDQWKHLRNEMDAPYEEMVSELGNRHVVGWKYNQACDQLSIAFEEDNVSTDHPNYHSLWFLHQSVEDSNIPKELLGFPGWKAVLEFEDDIKAYKTCFVFEFAGINLKSMIIQCDVSGLETNYSSFTSYSR